MQRHGPSISRLFPRVPGPGQVGLDPLMLEGSPVRLDFWHLVIHRFTTYILIASSTFRLFSHRMCRYGGSNRRAEKVEML